MHVGIVSPEFPPDVGGVETYAREYALELGKRPGFRVTVFTHSHQEGEAEIPGAKVRPLLRVCRRADRKALAQYKIDVWHVMNAAYSWLALEKTKVVVSVHGNDFLRPYYPITRPYLADIPLLYRAQPLLWSSGHRLWTRATGPLVERALPHASHIFANSRFTEKVLLANIPGCKGKTSVGSVGTPSRFLRIKRRPAPDKVPRLLTVSRLSEPRKNVDLVIKALSSLKDRYSFFYTVVGDGHGRTYLETLSSELGLSEQIRFVGRVEQEQLELFYAEADLFILTSSIIPGSHEGFGSVYLEAAASGVPSLAALLGGAEEAVEEGVSGMFVNEPSIGKIGESIETFLRHSIEFNEAACRKFAKSFSYKKVVDHCIAYYGAERMR